MKTARVVPFLLGSVLTTSLAVAQLFGSYSAPANVPIPPTGTGAPGCGPLSVNVTNLNVNVPDAFVVAEVHVILNLTHSFVGDLTLTLKHCGVQVEIYDRTPASASNLDGIYTFADQAVQQFSQYVTISPTVPAGSYAPVNPLAPFNGMSSAGTWTLSICDQAVGDVGVVTSMSLLLFGGLPYGGPISPAEAIPDGNGSCLTPAVRAVNVPYAGIVDQVAIKLGLSHTDVNDLTISLAHDGVVVTLTQAGTMASGRAVQGLYTFLDYPYSFVNAVNTAPFGSNVSPGVYGPATPLSAFIGHSKAGVWLVTVCDSDTSNVGILNHAELIISDSPWNLALSQPNGSANLVFTNSGGVPGNTYLNLATVDPGSFPDGWLNGLDISITEMLVEISLGPPVIGPIGPCGNAGMTLAGPIPPGLAIQFVSFELDSSWTPVATKRAFQYVTQ